MTPTLLICATLTTLLGAYSLGHYLCAVVFLLGRAKKRTSPFSAPPVGAVAVLIPAKNEARGALRAITSLLQQDHAGPIEIHLLLKDATDTSIPFLKAAYPAADFTQQTVELLRSATRTVFVAFTGSDPKTDKINWITGRLTTPYLAILDADHQAEPDWVRTSLCVMAESGARIVQGRRSPISARGFFPLWDSLHQHIGCELFNAGFTRMGLTVFFSGTTAIMETSLLRAHPLGACITEDIDFSYTIMLEGIRIAQNPHSGSSEETSPDLYSFLARRRRWSNGHTGTFLRHLRPSFAAPISMKERAQFLYHGSHYLMSVLVFLLHLAIGMVFIRSLSISSGVAAVGASIVLGAWIARGQRTLGFAARAFEVAVLFGWLFPAVVIAMNLVQAILVGDLARAALPIPGVFQAIGLIGLCAPLIVLLMGLGGFGQLSLWSLVAVVATYPLAFYLDISGVLLGVADYATGAARWRPVSRAAPAMVVEDAAPVALVVPAHIRESCRPRTLLPSFVSVPRLRLPAISKPSRIVLAGSLLALFAAGVFYQPGRRMGAAQGKCEAMEQDDYPWIVPQKKLQGYCGDQKAEIATRTGTFKPVRHDDLTRIDPAFWDRMNTTFPCNLATFSPDHAQPGPGGLSLALDHQPNGGKDYTSGSIATKNTADATYTYGRFETRMKPAKTSGVISAFFLYRFDPWQEIDAEVLGKDTTRLLVNVYYNPGDEGDLYNYGFLGTPVMIDLGFDASLDFHTYAIEWEADEIRWLVDEKLVHVRRAGRPTPIPRLPMRLHASLWPNCSEKLVGPFTQGSVPAAAQLRSIGISSWYPSPLPRFSQLFSSEETRDWRIHH